MVTHIVDAGVGDDTAGRETALSVRGLAKAFGPTQALRSCTFDLRSGEVHAIIGENRSGKSTLVKILAGIHRPDDGEIEVGLSSVSGFRSPRAANAAGIFAVFQEVLSISFCSVIDNVTIGADELFREHAASRTRAKAARLVA